MEIWITPIALIVLILFFKITLFSNIPGKYENVSSLPKILETGINVFISNSLIITIKTYYEKSTIYKCGER